MASEEAMDVAISSGSNAHDDYVRVECAQNFYADQLEGDRVARALGDCPKRRVGREAKIAKRTGHAFGAAAIMLGCIPLELDLGGAMTGG